MNVPTTHDPVTVTTTDGVCWVRRAVTRDGCGLYAVEGTCRPCPEFLLATLPELAEHGITGQAHALPMPVGTASAEVVDEAKARAEGKATAPATTATPELLPTADVVAWLTKKAREFQSAGGPVRAAQADAVAALASKVARGAVRAHNLRMLPEVDTTDPLIVDRFDTAEERALAAEHAPDDGDCAAEFTDGSWTYCGCPDCEQREADDAEFDEEADA